METPDFNSECLTVSRLNGLIREVLNMGFPQAVWVCGEIQNYDRNKNKNHIFFELCEKDPKTKEVVGRVGLVIFASRKTLIDELLRKAENNFALRDDIEVKFLCRVDFYPPHGALRLVVESIDPAFTLGKIAQERQKLIALLKENGTLEKNKERPLAPVPLNIGLITAHDSAAYNDFISELKLSGFGFKVFYIDTLMQGNKTERAVCRALDILGKIEELEAIVITRGGGSIAELSCFDSRKIAEKIAACPLPVLSGIGHEINTTVTDLAAHLFAKTPTAVARLLIQRVEDFLGSLKDAALNLRAATTHYLKSHDEDMLRISAFIKEASLRLLAQEEDKLARQKEAALKALKTVMQNIRAGLLHHERMIEMAKPANTLKRGFSITRTAAGQLVKSAKQLKDQDKIKTEFGDGVVVSAVQKQTIQSPALEMILNKKEE